MKFEHIHAFNAYIGGPAPKHPSIDLGQYDAGFLQSSPPVYPIFYRASIKYGLEEDRQKGYMYFSSPNQPIEWEAQQPWSGYYLNIAEDLISAHQHLNHSFLTYGLHQPLHLQPAEEQTMTQLFEQALHAYQQPNFSVEILVAYCNLIFAHVAQFYKRQFGEQREQHSHLVHGFFNLLERYYHPAENTTPIQPSVHQFAQQLHVTPNYLSDLIKFHTGKPALEHIHQHIIATAKPLLSQSNATVAEISHRLGFEYPNYFSRLFRKITGASPSHFRRP